MPLKVGIVGAGMAGLTLATRVSESGHSAICFDKGRGVGGRTSTRRTESTSFDHGAQYFTMRDPRFRSFLQSHVAAECWSIWNGRFGLLTDERLEPETKQEPRYVGVPGMNAIARDLASRMEVKVDTRVVAIDGRAGAWNLIDSNGNRFGPFDWVVSTAPPVQTVALLEGRSSLVATFGMVRMRPCFALMVAPRNGTSLPFDGIRAEHPVLGWLANNNSKPGRAPDPALVIQSNNDWAEIHVDDPPDKVAETLRQATNLSCGIDLESSDVVSIHRWLYAKPVQPLGQACVVDQENQLGACGDWCLAGKVEGAFLSGLAMAEAFVGFDAD